ncbi:hypothetical protein ABBQ38_009014 [Trebouxia sp. C0009 RCD-2024]
MAGSLSWRPLSNCKCVWQNRGQCSGAVHNIDNSISARLLRHPCLGASRPHHIWRSSYTAVANWHGLYSGRLASCHTSMLCRQAPTSKATMISRHSSISQPAVQQTTMTDSGFALPGGNMSVNSDLNKRQRETVAGTGNPPKWPDWGIYNYKAVVAYDGTTYKCAHLHAYHAADSHAGFQLQKGTKNPVPTIQGVLEKALCQIRQESRETLRMQCSGRTDAGVHAKGQVINFYSNKLTPDCSTMMHSLARMLPDSISVLSMQRVPPDFHARYTAQRKTYHYYLHVGNKVDPFTRWHRGTVLGPVDLTVMRQTAETLVGQYDYTHFASLGNPDPNPIKTIHRFDILRDTDGYVFQVEGSGFMYKMVRHMVGALLAVGAGNLDPSVIAQKLEIGSKEVPGEKYRGWSLAEPQGLFLMNVTYPPHGDHTALCHPDIQHDSAGRPLLGREAGQE